MDMINDNQEISPKEYFEQLKSKQYEINDEDLQRIYAMGSQLLKKYQVTGQTLGIKKLIFQIETIEKERKLVKLGINKFIYRDDIEEYIDKVSKNTVKIIELENYEREIPDEIVNIIAKTKHLFDKFYVVFTDYTGRIEKQVQRSRREKDPILFGTFQNNDMAVLIDRFYFLGDWIDEYCDLTLIKMVEAMKKEQKKDIEIEIFTPEHIGELKKQIYALEQSKNPHRQFNVKKNTYQGLVHKVTTFLKGK